MSDKVSAVIDVQRLVTRERIEQIVAQIVAGFRPRQVILFGSYAYGQPTRDSDVDLLVVMDADGQPLRAAARIAAVIDHPFSLDIVVVEPAALRASLARRGLFATDVLTKGIMLYEAGNDGVG